MNFHALLSLIITIFLLIVTGFVVRKLGIINEQVSKGISGLLSSVGMPFLILNALIRAEYSEQNVKDAVFMVGIGFGMHLIYAIFAFFVAKPIKDFDEKKMSEFAIVFTNCGFIGLPILDTIFPVNGVFWGSFFLVSFNVVVRTWGMMILARKRNDIKISIKKILLNTGTVPCAIGMLIYFLQLPLPDSVMSCCNYLGSICTPLSLIVTGALIATCPLKKLFCSWKIYYINLMKLIVMPFLVFFISKLIGLGNEYVIFCTVMASLPTAAVATMFGDIYDIASGYASAVVGVTSLLSVATIPAVFYLAERLLTLFA